MYICGQGRHGKDEAANILCDQFGLSYESSSRIAMRLFLRGKLEKDYGLVYDDEDQCYVDRVNHRAEWFNVITDYNTPDRTAISRAIFKTNDIYVGIRNLEELEACRKAEIPDLVIWIDSNSRVGPTETLSSNTITSGDCDLVVENNGTLNEFAAKLFRLFRLFA